MGDNYDPDRVDWLDLGPDPDEGVAPRDPRRRYVWYGAAAGLVVLALVLTRTEHGTGRAASSSGPSGSPSHGASSASASSSSAASGWDSSASGSSGSVPAASASSGSFVDPPPTSGAGSTPEPPGAVTAAPPKVTRLGHSLLDAPADWELFGQGSGVIVRIQLALGRITTSTVPVRNGDAPVLFYVGRDRAFVHALDDTIGYVVRDGKQAEELPRSLRQTAWMHPGPNQQQLWADQFTNDRYGLALLKLDGSPTGVTLELPTGTGVLGSDEAGYLVVSGIGGVYDVRPGRIHRITNGILLAGGATRWLAVECDDSLSCANVVIDRASGARHTLDTPVDSIESYSGTISPDGRTAALLRPGGGTPGSIHLVDLDSGDDRVVDVVSSQSNGFQTGSRLVWSPDSRWLFTTDAADRIIIVNRGTGKATPLGTRLPPVTQLALRHSTG